MSAHVVVSKQPELDPQGFHRGVMGQCGQSNNCFPSLAVSFGTDLKGSESILLNFNHHPPPTPQALPSTSFSTGVGDTFHSFRDRETRAWRLKPVSRTVQSRIREELRPISFPVIITVFDLVASCREDRVLVTCGPDHSPRASNRFREARSWWDWLAL